MKYYKWLCETRQNSFDRLAFSDTDFAPSQNIHHSPTNENNAPSNISPEIVVSDIGAEVSVEGTSTDNDFSTSHDLESPHPMVTKKKHYKPLPQPNPTRNKTLPSPALLRKRGKNYDVDKPFRSSVQTVLKKGLTKLVSLVRDKFK